jgi:hypothetical protein
MQMFTLAAYLFAQRDVKIKQISQEAYNQRAVEVLQALKKIGEKVCVATGFRLLFSSLGALFVARRSQLSSEESAFLEQLSSSRMMEAAGDKVGERSGCVAHAILELAVLR